jgi:hypothetical protein
VRVFVDIPTHIVDDHHSTDHHFTLYFDDFATVTLFVSVILVNQLIMSVIFIASVIPYLNRFQGRKNSLYGGNDVSWVALSSRFKLIAIRAAWSSSTS